MERSATRRDLGTAGAWFVLAAVTAIAFALAFEDTLRLPAVPVGAAMIAACDVWAVGAAVVGWRLRARWWIVGCPLLTLGAAIVVLRGVGTTAGFATGSWTPFVLVEGALILAGLGFLGAGLGVTIGRRSR